MQQLQVAVSARQTLIASDGFLSAVADLQDALSPENIPGLPEGLHQELAETAASMQSYVHSDGRFPKMVAMVFLHDLRKRGLPKIEAGREEAAAEAIRRLIQGTPQDAAAQMVRGAGVAIHAMETIRGFGVELIQGATAVQATPDVEPHEATDPETIRTRKTFVEPPDTTPPPAPISYPLTDPASDRLVVEGVYFTGSISVVGPVVSDYKIEKIIGAGGCSKVHLAHEIGPKRPVAVKVVTLPSEAMREALFRGFRQECELQGALSSDRFVHVYSTGKTAQGSPYIVMELLSGGALSDFIGRQNLPTANPEHLPFNLEQILTLASQVVAAAAEAQRSGIVHRDIKPENYFLTADHRAKLGDFGISKRLSEGTREPPEMVTGTPGYVPPENFPSKGSEAQPDTYRRDVFALGVTLYELLTGHFPFHGNSALSLLVNSTTHHPPPPSEVRPERKIPPALDRIVMKAMSKEAGERYADAQELLFALVTHQAQTLEEEAARILRQSLTSRTDEKINRDEWRELIQRALAEYRRVYDEYPSQAIRDKMLQLNLRLHEWADTHGDDETVLRAGERIRSLAPTSPPARAVSLPIRVQFDLSGKLPKGAVPELTLVHFVNRAGFLEQENVGNTGHELPAEAIDLPRGGAYGLHFAARGVTPLFIPLPVRPGQYSIRIPIYTTSQVPPNFVVIPAGPVAARQGPGSYSERFENWRSVEHDFAVGPLVTNRQWIEFLQHLTAEQGRDTALDRLPKNWAIDAKGNFHLQNAEIIADAPVTHISYENALEYLQYLSGQLGVTVRFPTLNKWKRTLRGNDARPWPWGNAMPETGVAGFRFSDPRASGAVVALPNDAPGIRDFSPFSVPPLREGGVKRMLPHVAGNVQKFLDLGTPREQQLISRALGLTPAALRSNYYLVAGASYEGAAPIDLDILQHKPRHEVGATGIMPVIELRHALPTPLSESLQT